MLMADTAPSALANVECEAALLGALMIENKLIDRVCEIVDCEDFSEAIFGRVYSLIVRERSLGKAANVVTLHPYLVDDPDAEAMGGPGFLAKLTSSNTVLIGAMDFAKQVADLAKRRRFVSSITDTLAEANDPSTAMERLVDLADAALLEATSKGETIHQITGAQCIDELFASYDDTSMGATCGNIAPIDRLLGEMRPKQLIIGAGRPGMGKTAAAISYGLGAARRGHGVLYVTIEMSSVELAQRMAADLCFDGGRGVPFDAIRDNCLNADQKRQVARTRGMLEDMPFYVIDAPYMTIGRLGMLVRRYKRRLAAKGQSLDVVIVDYLQLLSTDDKGRSAYETVSAISRALKGIAKDNSIAMFALAQLSRAVETRPDKRPMLSDLRDSGQIEQDADAVLFLYRHEYYLKQSAPNENAPEWATWRKAMDDCQDVIEFICAKRRNGATGSAQGRFHTSYQAVRG